MSEQGQAAIEPKTLFGHPRGLYVLFFTEMWERFSFYGMKTLLVLYMLNHFFWSQEKASGVLGLYAFLAYGLPVVGGFIADHVLGARRAVIVGGVLLSIGHILMAFEPLPFFYTALGFIIAGVGLLKPNVSTQVGALYHPGDPRRDGAFTIFYMGINLGALIGPLLCDWLRVHYGYHYGFAAAGVGMILGLIVYVIGQRALVEFKQDAGDEGNALPGHGPHAPALAEVHPPHVVRDRLIVLFVVFAFVILFWTAFEQSPNAMLVWADKHTNLNLFSTELAPVTLDDAGAPSAENPAGSWGKGTISSGQTQSFNPFFIITLAPLFAALWIWLDKRKLQPSTPAKMVLGLALVAVAFAVMWPAARAENRQSSASLAELPLGVDLRKYGATRLDYDAVAKTLIMHGVLTDNDRYRVLADSAPPEFAAEVDKFAAGTNARTSAENPHAVTLNSAPAYLTIMGAEARTILTWDAASRRLTATGEVKERMRVQLLAGAADPEFKRAIDEVYLASAQYRVSVWWLILFFLCLTMGELCLSPVGLSLVTKLAPAKHVGLLMGGWFLATAAAEWLAQVFGAWWGTMPPGKYFTMFVVMCGGGALVMALLVRTLKRMMHGVH